MTAPPATKTKIMQIDMPICAAAPFIVSLAPEPESVEDGSLEDGSSESEPEEDDPPEPFAASGFMTFSYALQVAFGDFGHSFCILC